MLKRLFGAVAAYVAAELTQRGTPIDPETLVAVAVGTYGIAHEAVEWVAAKVKR